MIETLNKILPVVVKVHKDHHPELEEVLKNYEAYLKEDSNKEEIKENLIKVTNNFAIPGDACPTFTKAYELLKELVK